MPMLPPLSGVAISQTSQVGTAQAPQTQVNLGDQLANGTLTVDVIADTSSSLTTATGNSR